MQVTALAPGVRPDDWLREQVARRRASDALAPVTVVSSSTSAALSVRRGLGRTATGTVNVRCTVLPRLAESIGAPMLATKGFSPVTPLIELAIARHLLSLPVANDLRSTTPHRSTVEALAASLRRLRQQELSADARTSIARRTPLAATLTTLLDEYEALLRDRHLYDALDLFEAAAHAVHDGAALADVGSVILHTPLALSARQCRLLSALDGRVGVAVSLLDGGPPEAAVAANRLTAALRASPPAIPLPTEHLPTAPIHLVTAPSPLEEVRIAVRRALADCEAGTPLHRIALLHNDERIYGNTLRDTLAAASIPSTVLGGRPLSESHAARGLLGLLRLRRAEFSRVAVVTWLASFPRQHHDILDSPVWDRLSRDSGVVCGVDSWRTQLSKYAERNRSRAGQTEGDAPSEAHQNELRRKAEQAEQILASVVELEATTTPPAEQTWSALSTWAVRLLHEHVTDAHWPAPEKEAAATLEEVLTALPQSATFEPAPTVDALIDTLDRLLESRHRPEGRLGTGVVVGTVDAAAGMTFDRIHILGMTESSFPSRPMSDPFLPSLGAGDPLDDREERIGAAALAYTTVCAGTDPGGSIHLSTPTWDGADRPVYPSRWFVAAAGRLGATPITSARARSIPSTDWMTAVPSPHAGLRTAPTPLNLAERRLGEVAERHADGQRLRTLSLAARDDLPLGRGLAIRRARWSVDLTAADGNLADLDLDPDLAGDATAAIDLAHLQSATGLQKWAKCPYSYFLERVLKVQATNRPEADDRWSLGALERGSAVHAIVEQFFAELIADGRPRAAEAYTPADHARLRAVGEEHLDRITREGITGHPLVWATTRASILADLETFLGRDTELRAAGGWIPFRVEQQFGYTDTDPTSWQPVTVAVAGGMQLRLRGKIDRVDVAPSLPAPVTARVLDYKTGGARVKSRDLDADVVRAGEALQLPLYARAVREAHPAITHVEVAYWYLSTKGGFELASVTLDDAADARLTEVLDSISSGIRAGAFPQAPGGETYRPGVSSWDNCVYCPFDRVCPSGRDALHDRKAQHAASQMHGSLTLPGEDDA